MKPITHHDLCKFIRAAMERRKLPLAVLADRAKVQQRTLALMFAGQAFFNIRVLASVAKALEVDYSHITAGYALWRYQETLAELSAPEREPEKKRGQYGQDDLGPLAQSIVASHPGASTDLLIQHLLNAVPGLFEPIAATAIQKATSSQNRGDYDAA